MNLLWDVSVKADLLSLFFHGLFLTIVLLMVSIPVFVLRTLVPSIVTTIVLFVVYCFIDGFIAESIGSFWEEKTEDEGENEVDVRLSLRALVCGGKVVPENGTVKLSSDRSPCEKSADDEGFVS
jgi:hypothetical protein